MDQLKVALGVIKKHHFWILCGIIVLVVLAAWWSATAGLAGMINQRRDDLEGKMSRAKGISTEAGHANQDVIEGLKSTHQRLAEEVRRAWRVLYSEQKKQMQWPDLGWGFREFMDLIPPDAPIPDRYLDLYMNSIQQHFKLYEIVDLRLPLLLDEKGQPVRDENRKFKKIDPFESARATTGYSGMDEGAAMPGTGRYTAPGYQGLRTSGEGQVVGLVDWDMNNLKKIRDRLYWPNRPLPIQVRLAQEDLWVYEALARIIAATNEGATNYHNAAVKRIDRLEIGREAAAAFAQSRGRALRTGAGAGSGMYPGDDTMMSPGYMEEGMPASMGETGAGSATMPGMYGPGAAGGSPEERIKATLLTNRYVDQDGMPIGAGETTETEFKMMPVRMLLLVDQRKITRLLVECANSALPVEVTKVALNPGKATLDFARMGRGAGAFGYSGAYDEGGSGMTSYPGYPGGTSMMPGGTMPGGAMYDEEGAGTGMPGGMGRAGLRSEQQTSYDVPIEIQGIIYFFNRPDSEKIGAGEAPAQDAAPAPAGPAAPAPAPPVAPPPAEPIAPPPVEEAGPEPAEEAGPAPAGPAAPPTPAAGGVNSNP